MPLSSLLRLASLLAAPALAGCLIIETEISETAESRMVVSTLRPAGANTQAPLLDARGEQIGVASFTEGPRGVLIQIDIAPGGVTPGWHGAHFHAVGDCHDHHAGFMASSGHLGRGEGVTHGFLSANGPEAGDLTNLFAPEQGPIRAEMFSTTVTLASEAIGGRMPLLDADGAALVIHAGPDDYVSQPVGMAGARAACGVLARG